MHITLSTLILLAGLAGAAHAAGAPEIPRLDWQPRSDWINVRADAQPPAAGDGAADDTAALQAALDLRGPTKAVYLPAGTYRITRTLTLTGPATGCLVVGHGRDTRLVWDGPEDGVMFRSNGAAYSRYVGLSWDGRGKAAVGFDHASEKRFETEVRHEHEAFRNFRTAGIRIGHQQKIASAEILYWNCLFEECGTGVRILAFNDYDNTFDRCEFRRCGTGIYDDHGNFYARNCHFEASRETDFWVHSEHGDSVRRCTSYGSKRFLTEASTIAPLTIQECQVAAWTDPEGAVFLDGSPVLMFDCAFTEPPAGARPPVRLLRANQILHLAANHPADLKALVAAGPQANITPIEPIRPIAAGPGRTFLRPTARVPSRTFDAVRDFGAKGDGKADDTAALQATIDAARKAGEDALAYLPTGSYVVSKTLSLTGEKYRFGGSGFRCGLVWRGPEGDPILDVAGVRDVTLEHFAVGHHDSGPMKHGDDIRVTAPDGRPVSLVLDEVYAFGMYQKHPEAHGIHFIGLPRGSVVDAPHVQGNLKFEECARATFLFRTSYEGTVSVWGKGTTRDGFLGFMTRLATLAGPTLWVRDNHSVTLSDFYDEQSQSHLLLEGTPDLPPGAITLQGAKTHLLTQEPVIALKGYAGRVYYGQNQFYIEPKEPKFVATGDAPARLLLAGSFFYKTTPAVDLPPSVRLTLLGNIGPADAGVDAQALADYAAALGDLRRLGAVEREVDAD